MTRYKQVQEWLVQNPQTWLVTGVAGFIGSHLLEALLKLDQRVVGLDNFATGNKKNFKEVKSLVTQSQWDNFHFIKGDIRKLDTCRKAMTWHAKIKNNDTKLSTTVDHVLHQAALGSVPRSLEDPITTNASNITGFLNILVASRNAKVKSFVYAASSSTYGDHPAIPKVEENIGKPLSPYAVTKYANELYAEVFASCYGFNTIGLRYFNVFGPRQDPNGAYAAVIPKWTASILQGRPVFINGDGETSRDFCFIANTVQANLLAATTYLFLPIISQENILIKETIGNQIYNIALNNSTSLNILFSLINKNLALNGYVINAEPIYRDFRMGDVRHSLADISKAKRQLGYEPTHNFEAGIIETIPWYLSNLK